MKKESSADEAKISPYLMSDQIGFPLEGLGALVTSVISVFVRLASIQSHFRIVHGTGIVLNKIKLSSCFFFQLVIHNPLLIHFQFPNEIKH